MVELFGDLNAKDENEVIGGIVGQYGVQRRNDNGKQLLKDVCSVGVSGWQQFVNEGRVTGR